MISFRQRVAANRKAQEKEFLAGLGEVVLGSLAVFAGIVFIYIIG